MTNNTKDGNLRAPLGVVGRGYRIYIPRILENGDYHLPPRGSSILKGCLVYKSHTRYKEGGRNKVLTRFEHDLHLSKKLSHVLSLRNPSEIKRIEIMIQGIFDSLLLFDQNLFVTLEGYRILCRIVRKVFAVCSTSFSCCVSDWKKFTLFVFHKCADSVTEENVSLGNSIFTPLLSWEKIKSFTSGRLLSKVELSELSQLISTRQLPAGGRTEEIKALKDLKEINTRPFDDNPKLLKEAFAVSFQIGRHCRKAGLGPIKNAHLSLATAGSFEKTVLQGGRAKEILEAITPILTYVPVEQEILHLGHFKLVTPPGIARWRTWCRFSHKSEPYILTETGLDTGKTEVTNDDFGKPLVERGKTTLTSIFDNYLDGDMFSIGFDDAIGEQILACALYTYELVEKPHGNPVQLRTVTIPEPGLKARIVTTGPWWVYVIMQPVAHMTRGYLGSFPPAEAGMMRTDQAWQYLYRVNRARKIPLGSQCLSSDLTAATDHIPHSVAKGILKGFLDGLGVVSPLAETAIELLAQPRLVYSDLLDEAWFTVRGVFMGEPLAKTTLTLLNCVAEGIAIRQFLGIPSSEPVQVSWRCLSVAGDDHIAIGPVDYLDLITSNHIRLGSEISKSKHSRSAKLVNYCEKILDVTKLLKPETWTVDGINDSMDGYLASPFVDSVKVRLLSPCSKTNETFNEKNTAIGKCISLGNTLRWLKQEHFPYKWRSLVRDRCINNMGSLLPDRSSGVYWHLLLPQSLGGLDLWFPEDIPELCYRLPSLTKSLIKELSGNPRESSLQELFAGFTRNKSYRGYELPEEENSRIDRHLKVILNGCPSIDYEEAVESFPDLKSGDFSAKQILSRLNARGIKTLESITESVSRPILFKNILEGRVKSRAFSTMDFKARYSNLWDLAYNGECSITTDDVLKAIKWFKRPPLYNLNETVVDYDDDQWSPAFCRRYNKFSFNIIEENSIGFPDLKIRYTDIGVLASGPAPPVEDFSLGEYV